MHHLREWLIRLVGTLRPRRTDSDIQAELHAHLELGVARPKMSGDRRGAVLRHGTVAQAMETTRDQRGLPWLRDLGRDLRYGARLLRREPAFAIIAVVSLALGIGANTAAFSVVNAVILRPLPVERPADLVFLDIVGSAGGGGAPPYPCFERIRRETTAFAGIAAFATDQLRIDIDGSIEQVLGQVVSGNYFETLGIAPAVGRLLTDVDERDDAHVAVISDGFWRSRFGGDANVLGRAFRLRGRTYTVVGVTPRDFWGLEPGQQVDVIVPISVERQLMADASSWWFSAVARVQPSANIAAATSQVDTIFQSFIEGRHPSDIREKYFDHARLTPAGHGGGGLRTRFSTALYAVTLAAALTLVLACVNLAGLLLVRGAARAHEFSIRLATGAGRSRLIRQLLAETSLLFASGAALGIVIAALAVRALTMFLATGRTPVRLDVPIDWHLAGYAFAIGAVAAVTTGLWPAIRAIRANSHDSLNHGRGRVAGSRRVGRLTRTLVAAQVALALVLLVTTLFFVQSMRNLRALDPGFDGTNVLTMSVDPAVPSDGAMATRTRLLGTMLDRLRAMPGVQAASLSVVTPLSGRDRSQVIETNVSPPSNQSLRVLHINPVSEDYFQTFGIQIVAGRAITTADGPTSPRVIVLTETAAQWFFQKPVPIGEQIQLGNGPHTVVGVVRDFKHLNLREEPRRSSFVSLWQQMNGVSRVTVSVKSALAMGPLARAVEREVRAVHADTLVSDVLPMRDQIDSTLLAERLVSQLAVGFGALALLLASIGVHGVLSYSVTQRRSELAVRSALGAAPAQLVVSVTRHVFVELLAGVAIGLVLSVGAVHVARSLLFDVALTSPAIYALGCLVLLVVAVLAAAGPAARAWSISPAENLRRG